VMTWRPHPSDQGGEGRGGGTSVRGRVPPGPETPSGRSGRWMGRVDTMSNRMMSLLHSWPVHHRLIKQYPN